MVQLNFPLLISTVLLFGCGLISAKHSLYQLKPLITIDRSVENNVNYFLQPVVITAFTVSNKAYFIQFTLPKVFASGDDKEIDLNYVEAIIKMYEINPRTDLKEEIFEGESSLNSMNEVNVKLHTPILLDPAFIYEIHLETFSDEYLHFKNVKKAGLYRLNELNLFTLNILQRNPSVQDQCAVHRHLNASHGAIKQMQFKRIFF